MTQFVKKAKNKEEKKKQGNGAAEAGPGKEKR